MLSLIRKKKGFTLVELGASLGVVGTLAIINAQEAGFATAQDRARAMGNEIFTYNSGVSRFLAAKAGDPPVSDGEELEMEIGSDWLKGSECFDDEVERESFLPCEALPGGQTIQYGSVPTTTIYSSEGALSARTVWTPVMGEGDASNGMVMGLAALVASGNYISQHNDAASGYQYPTVYCPGGITPSAPMLSICGDGEGEKLISRAGLSSSVEPWLRTDHGNTMRHVIEFNKDGITSEDDDLKDIENRSGKSWRRQILGVSRIYNGFGEVGQSLTLGGRSGEEGNSIYSEDFLNDNNLLNGAIVLDGDVGVMNDFYVNSDAFFSNIEATGNIRADGDIIGKRFVDADNDGFYVDPLNTSKVNVIDATRFRDINNTGRYIEPSERSYINDLTAYGDVRATRFYDQNDTTYYTDPASTSKVNVIDATRFRDINSTGRYIQPSERSHINHLTAYGDVRATRFYDQNDTTYYTDPASTSIINALQARGRIEARNRIYLTANNTEGGNCSPNGLVSKKADGTLMSCVSGKWKASGGGGLDISTVSNTVPRTVRARVNASVSCPSNRVVISGGCHLSYWRYVLTSSRKSGNGWACSGAENWGTSSATASVNLTAYAHCALK